MIVYSFNNFEVRYAIKEYAMTAVDVIARRLRLAFLNTYAAHETLEKVVDIMAKELQWSNAERKVRICTFLIFYGRRMLSFLFLNTFKRKLEFLLIN